MIFDKQKKQHVTLKRVCTIANVRHACKKGSAGAKQTAGRPLCQATAVLLFGAISMSVMAQSAESSSTVAPMLPEKPVSESDNPRIKADGKPAALAGNKNSGLVKWNGSVVQYPPPAYTVTGDSSLRQTLAEYGIGFIATSILKLSQNTLSGSASSGPPRGTQVYNGQKFTYNTSTQAIFLADLQRYGIENGQIVAGAAFFKTSWEPAGPSLTSLATLTYYQTLFKGQVELKTGYINNVFEYYGPYVGGNLAASTFGTSGTVPAQLGLSHIHRPRPGMNIQFNAGHFYNKFGVQKSSNPDGYVVDHDVNPNGFKWSEPNAGTLFIDELGYKVPSAPDQKDSWFRAGYIRNNSDYVDYKEGGRGNGHYGYYFMGDQQLYQFNSAAPRRGVFGGFSIFRANERYAAIDATYEGRIYTVGPFASRPNDMYSVVLTRNNYSDDARAAAERRGSKTHDGTWSFVTAYNAEVVPGIRAGLGLTYLNHPTPVSYTAESGEALTLNADLLFYW